MVSTISDFVLVAKKAWRLEPAIVSSIKLKLTTIVCCIDIVYEMLERTDRSSSNLPPGRYTLLDKTPAREVRNDFVNRTDDLDDFPALTSRNQAVEDHLSQTCKVSTDIPRPYQILCGHRVLRYVGASTKPANSVPTSRIKSSRALGLWIKLAKLGLYILC